MLFFLNNIYFVINLFSRLQFFKIGVLETKNVLKNQSWAKWDGKMMSSGDIYVTPYVFGTGGLYPAIFIG